MCLDTDYVVLRSKYCGLRGLGTKYSRCRFGAVLVRMDGNLRTNRDTRYQPILKLYSVSETAYSSARKRTFKININCGVSKSQKLLADC